jgi:hypothetical protein
MTNIEKLREYRLMKHGFAGENNPLDSRTSPIVNHGCLGRLIPKHFLIILFTLAKKCSFKPSGQKTYIIQQVGKEPSVSLEKTLIQTKPDPEGSLTSEWVEELASLVL